MIILRILVRAYQVILSPLLNLLAGPGGACRFEPSCSRYFLEAIERHGAFHGFLLGAGRLCRCHPWGGCGDDPVPLRIGARRSSATRERGVNDGEPVGSAAMDGVRAAIGGEALSILNHGGRNIGS